jgi:transposase, IS30 family
MSTWSRFEQPMLTIGQRPFQPEDRSQAGHWEGDLMLLETSGPSALATRWLNMTV